MTSRTILALLYLTVTSGLAYGVSCLFGAITALILVLALLALQIMGTALAILLEIDDDLYCRKCHVYFDHGPYDEAVRYYHISWWIPVIPGQRAMPILSALWFELTRGAKATRQFVTE